MPAPTVSGWVRRQDLDCGNGPRGTKRDLGARQTRLEQRIAKPGSSVWIVDHNDGHHTQPADEIERRQRPSQPPSTASTVPCT